MLCFRKLILMNTICLCTAGVTAALDSNKVTIGYLYPAGAQQGQTVQIVAGGQFLRGAKEVYVSGEGVSAKVVRNMPAIQRLNSDQQKEFKQRFEEARNKRLAELPPNLLKEIFPKAPPGKRNNNRKEDDPNKIPVKLPNNLLIETLDEQSLRELAHTAYTVYFPRTMLQTNRQLNELVLIEVMVDADAKPGRREIRILSNFGLSNPVVFQVGTLPEVRELEPNNGSPFYVNNLFKPIRGADIEKIIQDKPFEAPVLINGQIMPGDSDRFRFRAKIGQKLVIETSARSLIPYLADAVPGWFQAVVILYNAAGTEIAFSDDYRFNPDPVLFYDIPRDGFYEIEIRDSIYRGREDFVYRVAIGELPFVTQMYPLGGKEGVETTASIDGWNLAGKQLKLDTRPGQGTLRHTVYADSEGVSNPVPYAVDTLGECNEVEPNDSIKTAQKSNLPQIVNGQILKSGDIDVFQFSGRAGEKIAAEVYARCLNSPLDSLLQLTDASGKVLQWNDDYVQKEEHLHEDRVGLQTHHADSYLVAKLPKDGTYYVHLTDAEHHGSTAHSYRLRMAHAEGDFSLRVTPSGLSVPAGGVVPVSVYVLRKDGFEGPIEIVVKNPDSGFKISGGLIPAGSDSVRMTLTAPNKKISGRVALELEGRAQIGGKTIVRPAGPADDKMQAFLYRHLVPAQELFVFVRKSRWQMPPVELVGRGPVQIPAGGSVQVRLKTRPRPVLKEIDLELYEPPAGITLHDVTVVPEGLAFVLKADKDVVKSDVSENLIIQMLREFTPKRKEGKPAPQKQRGS
ncbi:MAG: hypothetical protein ACYTEN_09940, partial [Planctomycetota bacterium]